MREQNLKIIIGNVDPRGGDHKGGNKKWQEKE